MSVCGTNNNKITVPFTAPLYKCYPVHISDVFVSVWTTVELYNTPIIAVSKISVFSLYLMVMCIKIATTFFFF